MAALALLVSCSSGGGDDPLPTRTGAPAVGWLYQLSGYPGGRLDALVKAPGSAAVIDLARDGGSDYFTKAEVARLHSSGKRVLAYFVIGSIEKYRPEYAGIMRDHRDLVLNRWADWPDENFVRYWDDAWWRLVVQPRVDQALAAGFDGAYLDVPNAYEEIDLALVPGESRDSLGAKMARLITRISDYAKRRTPSFQIVPQNSPELQRFPGYTDAIDGIGVEELFYLATDEPCTQDFCAENLDSIRALRRAGKFVLAVDYATRPDDVARACARYRREGLAGYVTTRALDRISPPCE
jgi:cysteinyl-tRNA synthetase